MKVSHRKKKRANRNFVVLRNRFFIIFLVLCLLAGAGVGSALLFEELFKITSVEVAGESRYAAEDIIAASEIHPGENLFFVNKPLVQENIQSRMPYLGEIAIRRRLPDKVYISVEEKAPMALVEREGQYVVIDDEMRVLEIIDNTVNGLVVLTGLDVKNVSLNEKINDDAWICGQIKDLLGAIKEGKLDNVTKINLGEPGNFALTYDDRIDILLGDMENLLYKISTAVTILNTKMEKNDRGTLNVSIVSQENCSYFMPKYFENAAETTQ